MLGSIRECYIAEVREIVRRHWRYLFFFTTVAVALRLFFIFRYPSISGDSLVLSIEQARIRRSARMNIFSSAAFRPPFMLKTQWNGYIFPVALAGLTAILLLRSRG